MIPKSSQNVRRVFDYYQKLQRSKIKVYNNPLTIKKFIFVLSQFKAFHLDVNSPITTYKSMRSYKVQVYQISSFIKYFISDFTSQLIYYQTRMDYISIEHHYEDIPVKQQNRRCTDVICALLGIVFVLGLFVYALIAFIINIKNPSAYFNIDANLVVLPSTTDISKSDFAGFGYTLITTGILCVGIGLLWLTIVHNLPQYAPRIACYTAIVSLLIVTAFSIFDLNSLFQNYNWLKWTVVGLSAFIALLILFYMISFHRELVFQGLMLKKSVRLLNQRPLNFLDILIWLIFSVGFAALIMFQQLSFSYYNRKNNNLYDFTNPSIWGILNIIEYIWGIQFLKDSFIFVLSGNAIDWYWKEGTLQPKENAVGWTHLIYNNWGSVALGSFLNAFLKIPCLLLEIVICHPRGFCGWLGHCCENNFIYFLLYLVRTDSYALINLFAGGYCNSSFECVKLFDKVSYIRGKQSPQRNYRIVSTIFLTTVSLILSYLILMKNVVNINFWFIIVLFFHVYVLVEYFSSFHASVAEGLQTSALVEIIKEGGYNFMQHCHASIRRDLQYLQQEGNYAK